MKLEMVFLDFYSCKYKAWRIYIGLSFLFSLIPKALPGMTIVPKSPAELQLPGREELLLGLQERGKPHVKQCVYVYKYLWEHVSLDRHTAL